jgi:hypothetical protein
MARPRREVHNGKAFCAYHGGWELVEDFDWTSYQSGDGSVSRLPKKNCRLAEQTIRDHGKEQDPANAAIVGRAKDFARSLSGALGRSISYKWVLIELNWQALIPIMRALLGPDGRCLNCGRHRATARELHIEHRIPPGGEGQARLTDWAAQHARNLWIACGGCNAEKGPQPADRTWLDREQRKWMLDREWAVHAGQKGWPNFDESFGEEPLPGMMRGTLSLFDRTVYEVDV